MKFKKLLQITGIISFLIGGISSAYAAGSATISASPSSGTKLVNEEFNISVRVSGSTNFSAFRGNVSLTNLTVVSFTMNASNVLWISQPSAGSLNFNGAVKSAEGVSSLTVYTIRVKAPSAGSASINFSNGRVVGTDPVEDLGVGYANGNFTISAPPPPTTRRPSPTSPASATSTPTPTVSLTITPDTTSAVTITPTPTLTREQLTIIQIMDPNNSPLINSQIFIDDISYNTDNNGEIQIAGLSEGTHEIRYTLSGIDYEYSFVLGTYTGGKDFVVQFVNTQQSKTVFPLGNVLIIGGVLVIIHLVILIIIFRKKLFHNDAKA